MNRKSTPYLLACVLVIWGVIGYRLYSSFNRKEISKRIDVPDTQFNSGNVSFAFRIRTPQRDPFLNYVVREEKKKAAPAIVTEKKVKLNVPWPQIHYYGMICKRSDNKKLASIKIDNGTFLLRTQEEINGVKVLSIESDSVCVMFMKDRKYIYRNS